jgi:hypothetical protein
MRDAELEHESRCEILERDLDKEKVFFLIVEQFY